MSTSRNRAGGAVRWPSVTLWPSALLVAALAGCSGDHRRPVDAPRERARTQDADGTKVADVEPSPEGAPAPPAIQGEVSLVSVGGGSIEVSFAGEPLVVPRQVVLAWVERAAKGVVSWLGRFPVPRVQLEITTIAGSGVSNGVARPDGPSIRIQVGREATRAELGDDWVLTHEMLHLGFPSVEHSWLEEGLAVYGEIVARGRIGTHSPGRVWAELASELPQGQPAAGDLGIDRTTTWERTYWGGALFAFVADVEIRTRTENAKGLDDALRGIVAAGGTITEDWPIEKALEAGDRATGVAVLLPLYERWRATPVVVDLAQLWQDLGVEAGRTEARLDERAPRARVRRAILASRLPASLPLGPRTPDLAPLGPRTPDLAPLGPRTPDLAPLGPNPSGPR